MPHDPYKSCYGCPKPRPCDRSACDGWQYREAKKQVRYAEAGARSLGMPEHARQKREQNRWKKLALKGISTK